MCTSVRKLQPTPRLRQTTNSHVLPTIAYGTIFPPISKRATAHYNPFSNPPPTRTLTVKINKIQAFPMAYPEPHYKGIERYITLVRI
ncbi:uncharacterized protein METZ01_LOCUS491552, partial [marine metagenome]